MSAEGSIVFAHPEGCRLVVVDRAGSTTFASTPLLEMHCIRSALLDDAEVLWIADPGEKLLPGDFASYRGPHYESFERLAAPNYRPVTSPGRVVALSSTGAIAAELHLPAGDGPEPQSHWSPTAVAVDPQNRSVWVADGYGSSLVHQFSPHGQLLQTLDGAESGIAFKVPHDVQVHDSGDGPEVLVADRRNQRVVALSADGAYRRSIGEGFLNSPSGLAWSGDLMFVTELSGDIVVLRSERVIGRIGRAPRPRESDGWPNVRGVRGQLRRPSISSGCFNSPHGIATSADNLYVTEWMIGGRVSRLSIDDVRSAF